MDCGAPRFEGPKAKEAYEYMIKKFDEAKLSKVTNKEKRQKRLEEFSKQFKEYK